MERSALHPSSHQTALLCWCVAGSIAAHALLLTLLPGLHAAKETPPTPLTVALREPPREIVLPKPLPVEAPPPVKERAKPPALKSEPVKPEVAKPAPREERPLEQPRAPIFTAPPDAPVTAATPVLPEQRPVPPQPPQPPSPPPEPRVQPAPPAVVTAPRFEAAYLRNPAPDYPLAAKRRGESGTVLLRVLVTPEGNAASVSIFKTSGSQSLDEAARGAVTRWKFVPGREGDKPVQAEVHVPIVFNIKNE